MLQVRCPRIVNNWNFLPRKVVGAGSLNTFKNSLDSLWSKQDLLCNDYIDML